MAIIGIVAIDRNFAIGRGGQLPWHYSADMKFFKETTTGNAVVMGRRTWETLKGPLKDRQNIVLTGRDIQKAAGITVARDTQHVLNLAKDNDKDLFVIGGAKVYQAFLPHVDRWVVTEIPLTVADADTFMPANFLDGFELYEVRQLDEGLRVKFYERVSEARA
jgi:dihydrofolate reductase